MPKLGISAPYNSVLEAVKGGFQEISKKNDWNQYEYGFWVVFKPDENNGGKPAWHYTTPLYTDGSPYKVKMDTGDSVYKINAHCHTHPKGYENFSDEDKKEFEKLAADYYKIPFYLMLAPDGLIKYAKQSLDFPNGVREGFLGK